MRKLIGRNVLIKEHSEFKNDGSPSTIENIVGRIENVNEVYSNYHIQTEVGFYFEVKRRSFNILK